MVTLEQLFRSVDAAQEEIVHTLCDLIRIPTVNTGVMPTGNELPLCLFLQQKLAAEGIGAQILSPAENRANLIARLQGSTGKPRLLYMGHVDVVPVEDEGAWKYPPFEGTVADGRVWGRGAADMKDLVTAELMAMILLKRAGVSLKGDLILAAGADEETGGEYGFGWLAGHAPEEIRADFALNESNSSPLQTAAGLAYVLAVGEKGRLEVRITLRGKPAHAAMAWHGDNVAFKLAEVIKRLEAYRPELDVSNDFFAQVASLLDSDGPVTVENVDDLAKRMSGQNRALGSLMRGLSRMTFVPTMFQGGVKSNSVPASCTLVCDVRILPHQDEAYVRGQVEQILEGIEGASYELFYTAVPSASPYDTAFAAALKRATAAAAGRDDILWLPGLTVGFTDARLVRPLGAVIYGFGPGHPGADPSVASNAHGTDESSDIATLLFRTKMLIALACDVLDAEEQA